MSRRDQAPGWLHGLSDMVGQDLDHAGIESNTDRAAIFIAVQVLPDGRTARTIDVRGEGHALAEAAGFLAADRDLPGIIADAIRSALLRRYNKDNERDNQQINGRHV